MKAKCTHYGPVQAIVSKLRHKEKLASVCSLNVMKGDK